MLAQYIIIALAISVFVILAEGIKSRNAWYVGFAIIAGAIAAPEAVQAIMQILAEQAIKSLQETHPSGLPFGLPLK